MSIKPELAVFWGDTREILSRTERMSILQDAVLESLTPDEVLLRDPKSNRLIIVTVASATERLFCALCKNDLLRERYGYTCPYFAKCALDSVHRELH